MSEDTKDTRMLPVQCNCAWNPDRHADSCPVNLRDRLTDAQRLLSQLREELAQRDARIAELEAPMLEWAELDYTKHTRRSLMCYIGQQNFKITAQAKRIDALESQQAASVGGEPYPHGHELHKAVFMALECFTGSDTFEDGVRGLIAELKEARAALSPAGERRDGLPLVIAGAIFDFAGFLTTREGVIEVGATANASPVADLIQEWAELRGLSLADAAVLSWQDLLAAALSPAGGGIIPISQIERAARKLAECMDYPWEHMPDQGRCTMLLHAQSILEAAKPQANSQEGDK